MGKTTRKKIAVKWDKITLSIRKDELKKSFNEMYDDDCVIEDFSSVLIDARRAVLTEAITYDQGLFELSKKEIQPLIVNRNKILFEAMSLCKNNDDVK